MCWRTYYGMLSVQRTATKDIPVKKAFVVTMCEIRSLYFSGFRWIPDILRKTYLGNVRRFQLEDYTPRSYAYIIEKGFHSAKDVEKMNGYLKVSNCKGSGRILYPGYKTNTVILNCIIPKGSKYYINEYGEYVSDQLIVLLNS